MRYVLLALAVALAAVPGAVADTAPACEDVTADPAVATDQAYVRTVDEDVQAWQETNGVDGLQTKACTADGSEVPADTLVTTQPADAVEEVQALVGEVEGLVDLAIELVFALCDAVAGLLYGPGGSCF